MASMIDIKRRKASIQNTGQITKAMKLVATVKLQKSKNKAVNGKPYLNMMYSEVHSILNDSSFFPHPFLNSNNSRKKIIIVITSNRGLAGGYNSNIMKLVTSSDFKKESVFIYGIGRKGVDYFRRRGYQILEDNSEMINEPIYEEVAQMGRRILNQFEQGEIGEIYLAYTIFQNTVSQIPTLVKLLPIGDITEKGKTEKINEIENILMNYEPNVDEIISYLVPQYLNSLIYGALVESIASENAARMTAMDSATNNANDLMETLELQYNRARQGSITREITEIIAGANAIGQESN